MGLDLGGVWGYPIEELEIGVRTYNCLKRNGIDTIGDLVTHSEEDLAMIPNFGKKSREELKANLAAHGLALGTGLPMIVQMIRSRLNDIVMEVRKAEGLLAEVERLVEADG